MLAAVSLRDLRLPAAGAGESNVIRSPPGGTGRGLSRTAGSPRRLGSRRERRTGRAAAGVLEDNSVRADRRAAPDGEVSEVREVTVSQHVSASWSDVLRKGHLNRSTLCEGGE